MSSWQISGVGILAACLTTSSFLPQAFKTWRTRSAKDFSWSYLLMFGVGILLWDGYGWLRQDPVIVASNTLTLGLIVIIVTIKARFTD